MPPQPMATPRLIQSLVPDDPRMLGPWRLEGRIGEGGMGIVYLAQRGDGVLRALKLVRSELGADDGFLKRFRREAELARRVVSQHVAAVVDCDLAANPPYIVTEYVNGPTLQTYIESAGVLAGDQLVAFAAALAQGISAIHSVGVTHRDLKPNNVLLEQSSPKIVDFGIATAFDSSGITSTSVLMGAAAWMAPEELDGSAPRSVSVDVFTWGSLVAYAANGKSPWGDGRPNAVMYRILNSEPDLGGLSGLVRSTVAQALEKDHDLRPSIDHLLGDLVEQGPGGLADATTRLVERTWVLPPEWVWPPPPPPPPSSQERHSHPVGSPGRRLFPVLAVLAALGLIVGLVWSRWGDSSTPRTNSAQPLPATTTAPATTAAPTTTSSTTTTTTSTTSTTTPPPTTPPTVSLARLTPTNGYASNDPVTMDGVEYTDTVRTDRHPWQIKSVEFNLNAEYSRLTGTVGFSDEADQWNRRWELRASTIENGVERILFSAYLDSVGVHAPMDVDVTGVRRLELSVRLADDSPLSAGPSTNYPTVWANPILHE